MLWYKMVLVSLSKREKKIGQLIFLLHLNLMLRNHMFNQHEINEWGSMVSSASVIAVLLSLNVHATKRTYLCIVKTFFIVVFFFLREVTKCVSIYRATCSTFAQLSFFLQNYYSTVDILFVQLIISCYMHTHTADTCTTTSLCLYTIILQRKKKMKIQMLLTFLNRCSIQLQIFAIFLWGRNWTIADVVNESDLIQINGNFFFYQPNFMQTY